MQRYDYDGDDNGGYDGDIDYDVYEDVDYDLNLMCLICFFFFFSCLN